MTMRSTKRARAAAHALFLVLPCALGAASCGSDDDKTAPSEVAGPTAPATPANGSETSQTAPLYAVFTSVESDEHATTYMALTDSLEGSLDLDTSKALEAPEGSRFYAPETGGFFAIGNNEEVTITRYDVSADKSFVETGKVSFQQLGVTRLHYRNVFASETKAYYIDHTQAQVVLWNPKSMEVLGTVPLPPQVADRYQGYRTILPYFRYPFVEGKIFIPVAWQNTDDGKSRELTGLVVFDTATDSVLSYTETARCPAATELAFDDNGDVYFGTNVNHPFYSNADDPAKRASARSSCILRISKGKTSFDEDYTLRIADIAGGRVGMGLANAAAPGFGYVQVIDEAVKPWAEITDEDAWWETAAWRWWLVDLRKGTAAVDPNLPIGVPFIKTFEANRQRWVVQQRGDDRSQVFLLSPDGNHKAGITAVGQIQGVARVR